MRCLNAFVVRAGAMQVRVRLLPTPAEITREFKGGKRAYAGYTIHGYFQAGGRGGVDGTVTLPAAGTTVGTVAHEMTHAVLDFLQRAGKPDVRAREEMFCGMVGLATDRAIAELTKRGVLVCATS